MTPIEIPQKEKMPHHFTDFQHTHTVVQAQDGEVQWPKDWKILKKVALQLKTYNTAQLTQVLEKLSQSTQLNSLHIHWTDPDFPPILTKFSRLQHLGLVNHALRTLAANLHDIPRLRTLMLATTSLIGLPSGIGKMKKLREFYLMTHQMERLPKSFSQLSSLEYFGLLIKHLYIHKDWGTTYNFDAKWKQSGEALVQQLSELPQLRRLMIGDSQYPFFGVRDNHFFNPIPANLSQLQALEELELENCNLSTAVSFKELPKIKKFWGDLYWARDFLAMLRREFPQGQLVIVDPPNHPYYPDCYFETR